MGQVNNNKKTGQQKIDILIARGEMKPGTKWDNLSASEQYAADRLADEYYYRETRVNPVNKDEKSSEGKADQSNQQNESAPTSGGSGLHVDTEEVSAGESEKTDPAVEGATETAPAVEEQNGSGGAAGRGGEAPLDQEQAAGVSPEEAG